MKQQLPYSILIIILLFTLHINAQFCGIKDPSIERYASCPTSHSQLFNRSYHWFNVLNPSIATSDYYQEGSSCNFGGFIAAGGIKISYCPTCFSTSCERTYYPGCGRAGIFVNYFDGSQDPKYKEFIGTRVDLIRGRNYSLSIDIQRSNDPSSNTIERDLVIYGYNGTLPAAQVGYCPTGAVPLDTISRSLFNTDSNKTIISNFICPQNFSYLIIGGNCDGLDATTIGYVYLDKILLSDTRDSTLTPWIKFAGKDSRTCCYSGYKNEFYLVGNKAPVGTSVLWSQNSSNPQTFIFTTPTDSFTGINGTGYLTIGTYDFYYTWSKFGCSMTDTITVNVLNNARANAGPDIVFCNSNGLAMNALSPTSIEIATRGFLTWWSIIDTVQSNDVFTFPLSDPYRQACMGSLGNMSHTLTYPIDETTPPNTVFTALHQADTFEFIWNVIDECNTYTKDTVKTYSYIFELFGDSLILCPNDTSGYIFESLDSLYNSRHVDRARWYYTWSPTPGDTALQIVGNIHNDSIRLSSLVPGYHTVNLNVYDSANALCRNYTASMTIYVKDTIGILHPNDIVICGEEQINITQANVPLYTEWWWDVVDYSEPDSLFTLLNSEFPYLPNDGDSNIHVRSPNSSDSIFSTFKYTIFQFPYFNPQDTFTLIYNIRNSCYPFQTLKDTVKVITNYIELNGGPLMTCPGDTSILLFEDNRPIRLNNPNDTSLHYSWSQVGGTGMMYFDTTASRDTVICTVQNIPGSYTAQLTLYDSDDALCPSMSSTFTFNVLSPLVLNTMSAGPDINICNSQLIPYNLIMNATPSIATLNSLGYETWWSLLDFAEADSEYTFTNGCEPSDGFDNGNITCGFDLTCGSVTPYSSDAPNCFFIVDNWGCYDFIWHVRFICDGTYFYKEDTMRFCWDFLEPSANAGTDDTATCNVYQLIGNTSAASAANDGCFRWTQINSTTGVQISIADASNNIAYLLGLDTIAQGTYTFEYTIGCGACSKKDTVSIYINGSLPSPNISLSSNATDIYLCKGDSVRFVASGADQYQFFVNGISVNALSSNNIFTNGTWNIDTNIVSVIAYDADLGCFSAADTALIFILPSLDSLLVQDDSLLYCAGTQAYLVGYTPYSSQRIFWFTEADNFSTPLNLPNGTSPGETLLVAPTSPTFYKATLYDTLSKCWSFDSTTIKVIPVIAALPNPSLRNDTSICTYDDSIIFSLSVINQLYSGTWSAITNSSVLFENDTNPTSDVHLQIGNHQLIWTENNLGCTKSDSFTINIIPYPTVNAGNDTIICKGKQLQLNGSGDATNYSWIPLDSVIDANNLNTKTTNIYNNILLILEASNDICKSRDSIIINTIECPSDIKVPNAFSPNGDGYNDYFSVFTYQMKTYEIWIFNRWGENVYYTNDLNETNNLNRGWDGKYKGTTQDIGVYVYLIKSTNRDNEAIELKGNITLVK